MCKEDIRISRQLKYAQKVQHWNGAAQLLFPARAQRARLIASITPVFNNPSGTGLVLYTPFNGENFVLATLNIAHPSVVLRTEELGPLLGADIWGLPNTAGDESPLSVAEFYWDISFEVS